MSLSPSSVPPCSNGASRHGNMPLSYLGRGDGRELRVIVEVVDPRNQQAVTTMAAIIPDMHADVSATRSVIGVEARIALTHHGSAESFGGIAGRTGTGP